MASGTLRPTRVSSSTPICDTKRLWQYIILNVPHYLPEYLADPEIALHSRSCTRVPRSTMQGYALPLTYNSTQWYQTYLYIALVTRGPPRLPRPRLGHHELGPHWINPKIFIQDTVPSGPNPPTTAFAPTARRRRSVRERHGNLLLLPKDSAGAGRSDSSDSSAAASEGRGPCVPRSCLRPTGHR